MSPKELFQENGEACRTLTGIVAHRHFQTALLYAKQQWMEQCRLTITPVTVEAVHGFLDILNDLAQWDPVEPELPGPGLNQNLDVPPRKKQSKKEKKT